MAQDDFFKGNEDSAPAEDIAVEKVKIGDEEYSQEELQKLVGLGKIGLEANDKYKTDITKVWPKYQQVINEKRSLQEEYEKLKAEATKPQAPVTPQTQLTPDQIRAEAIKQAEELGIGPQAIRKTAMEVIQGQQLINDITATIDNMSGEGLPTTTVEDVIAHMQETGIRNPEKAYKDMFEKEWLASQSEKLAQIKSKGMPTISSSVAGGKQPSQVRVTKDNLETLVSEALNGSFQ